jgi:hypothetical protein
VANGTGVYEVSLVNTGSTPLSDIQLYSLQCTAFTPEEGDANGNGQLDPNEVWLSKCSATYPNQIGSWSISLDVSAVDADGVLVQAWVNTETTLTDSKSASQTLLFVGGAVLVLTLIGIRFLTGVAPRVQGLFRK